MLFPVRNLGRGGMQTSDDFPPADLAVNQVSYAENVCFRDGKALKCMGWEQIIGEVDGVEEILPDEELYWFDTWTDTNGIFAAFGCSDGTNSHIYTCSDGSTLVKATIQDSVGAADTLAASETWQMEIFGPFIIINNGVDDPLYNFSYNAGTDTWTFRPIPGWGANVTSPGGAVRSIRSYKNYLIAIGVEDTPYTVYWSDLGTAEDLPASWDYADPATQAGNNPLQTDDGQLVDGFHLNDRFVLYQDNAAVSMEYVAGDGVFSFRNLFNYGLVGHRAAQTFDGQQLFVSRDAIYIHDGSRIVRPADTKAQQRFLSEVTNLSKVFVAVDTSQHEVLIVYPSDNVDFPNRILKMNWKEDLWSFEAPEEFDIRCINEASLPATVASWADLALSWGSYSSSWSAFSETVRSTSLFQLAERLWSRRGSVFTRPGTAVRTTSEDTARTLTTGEERTLTGLNPVPYYAYVERGYLDLDEVTQQSATVKFLRAVYPQITGSGDVDFQFGISRTPNDPVTWGRINTLSLDTDQGREKINLRLTGRYLHWRVGSWQGVANSGRWQLSGMDLDIQMQGVR